MTEVYPFDCEDCSAKVRFGAAVEDGHRGAYWVGCRCLSMTVAELEDDPPEKWVLDMDLPRDPAEVM
jgi:hypothetical protein